MAYTEIPDADVDLNSPLDEDLFGEIRDNLRALRETVFGWTVTEDSTTSASFVAFTYSATKLRLAVPDQTLWTGRTRNITLALETKTSAGATGATLRLTGASGTPVELAVAANTSYTEVELELNGIDAGTGEFDIEGKVASGTLYIQSVDRATGLLEF